MALPSGYTQLGYLRATGTQYFNMFYQPKLFGRVECKFKFHTTGRQMLLASWGSATNLSYVIEKTATNNYNTNASGITKSGSVTTALNVDQWYELDYNLNQNYITINGNTVATTSGTPTCTRAWYLFASNDAEEGSYLKANASIEYLRLYDTSGILVHNYIPAYSEYVDAVGLFDEVEEVFWKNDGTGTFQYPYTISATVSPNNSGTVSGSGYYDSGSTATLEAIANVGYTFENWEFSEDKHNILESTCTTTPSFTKNSWYGWASWVSSYGPGTNNNYVTFKFDESIVITSYACSNHDDTNSTTWDFTIAGSNDGVNYTNIQTDSFPARTYKTVSVNNNTAYKYYRLIYSRYNNTYGEGRYVLRKLSFTGYRIGTNNDNPYNFVVYAHTNLIAYFKSIANCRYKVNGTWKNGIMYIKENGTWKSGTPKIKVNGAWKEGG